MFDSKKGKKMDEPSSAEYKPGGLEGQPPEYSEGTLTAGKGQVSPGKAEGEENEIAKSQPDNRSGQKDAGSQMKAPETANKAKGVQTTGQGSGERTHFLVTLPHSSGQCRSILNAIAAGGKDALSKWEWGCDAGDHTGYLLVSAENESEALNMVPERFRGKARPIKINRRTRQEVGHYGNKP